MRIIKSSLFNNFPELIFGLSTKIGLERTEPFYFNLSYTIGDNPEIVNENREAFYKALGVPAQYVAVQKQVYSDIVTIVEKPRQIGESDAMITIYAGIGLAISTADCAPIFIYDRKQKIIAGIHSGWRGTQKKILEKTLIVLKEKFNSNTNDMYVYIGPSISQKNYEVSEDVALQFNEKYIMKMSGKIYLDVGAANYDMLLHSGVAVSNIEVSPLCSYEEKDLLHSFRRDGNNSGRSHGVIAIVRSE